MSVASSFLVSQAVRNQWATERRQNEEKAREERAAENQQKLDLDKESRKRSDEEHERAGNRYKAPLSSETDPVKDDDDYGRTRPQLWNERNNLRHSKTDASPYRLGLALIMELDAKCPSTARCLALIEAGANLEASFKDDPRTPIMWAREKGNEAVTKLIADAQEKATTSLSKKAPVFKL